MSATAVRGSYHPTPGQADPGAGPLVHAYAQNGHKAEPSPASVGFPTQQKISAQAVFGACHPRDHIYTKAAQAATRSGRDKMNPTPSVGGGAGQWPEHYREDVAPACAFLNTFLSAFLGIFSLTPPLFPPAFPGDTAMAVNKPVGGNPPKEP